MKFRAHEPGLQESAESCDSRTLQDLLRIKLPFRCNRLGLESSLSVPWKTFPTAWIVAIFLDNH